MPSVQVPMYIKVNCILCGIDPKWKKNDEHQKHTCNNDNDNDTYQTF